VSRGNASEAPLKPTVGIQGITLIDSVLGNEVSPAWVRAHATIMRTPVSASLQCLRKAGRIVVSVKDAPLLNDHTYRCAEQWPESDMT